MFGSCVSLDFPIPPQLVSQTMACPPGRREKVYLKKFTCFFRPLAPPPPPMTLSVGCFALATGPVSVHMVWPGLGYPAGCVALRSEGEPGSCSRTDG